jgi:hypothetical protein
LNGFARLKASPSRQKGTNPYTGVRLSSLDSVATPRHSEKTSAQEVFVQKVLARRNATGLRGEELFFSDAGAVNLSRSPAGEATAPTHHGEAPSPAEVLAGIQGTSLLYERASLHSAPGRLT